MKLSRSKNPSPAPSAFLRRFCAGLLWLWPGLLFAQLPAARITSIFPPGGRTGSTVEVAVAGSDLDDAARLHFSNKDILATPKSDPGRFLVTIPANLTPGVYESRFVGRFGISNPRAFVVGAFPESIATTSNAVPGAAFELALNSTCNGRLVANSVAWFKFAGKKAQRLLIECLGKSIDSRMDAALVLTDEAGHELERNRTSGLLDFSPPADGTYFLKVFDVMYRGGDEYFYRLTLSNGPRIDFVMPPAGVPGTRTNYTLYGRNLPGGKPAKGLSIDGKPLEQVIVIIDIPANERTRQRLSTGRLVRPFEASMDGFEYRLSTAKGVSNPVLLGFATAPVLLETEPNSSTAEAQRLAPPCEVAGQFFPAGDVDWFTFDARKGDVWWIEVFSQRLGLPTDPFLLIQRVTKSGADAGKTTDVQEIYDSDANVGDGEFNTASRDPATRFEAKEEGTYRIEVRDLFQRTEHSPRFVYRLSLRKETPDFRLVAQVQVPKYKADAKNIGLGVPLLRRGETIPIRLIAFRRDGFAGQIDLSLDKPPPGLQFDGDHIEAGKNSEVILLTATDDAPPFAGPLKILGQAKVGGQDLVREARAGTLIFPVANTDTERPDARLAREFTLALTDQEKAPISIMAEKKVWESVTDAKLEIPLRIRRQGDFTAKLNLKPVGPGTAEALKEFDVEGTATNATLKLDLAALKLKAGTYSFAVQATTTGKYRNQPEAAAEAEAAAKEAAKQAIDLAAQAKKTGEELAAAKKTAEESEAAAKSARDKLAAAKVATAMAPEGEGGQASMVAAQKFADDASAAAEAALQTRGRAEKSHTAAEASAKTAQTRNEAAARRAKELTEKAKARELSYQVTSAPFTVQLAAAPPAKKPEPVAEKKTETSPEKK